MDIGLDGLSLPFSLTFSRSGTATYINSAGLIASAADGVARMGAYAPGGTMPGILMEGARTNLCLRSQEFDNASWTKVATTVTANSTTAPDGTSTADTVVEDGTTSAHGLDQNTTVTAATNTISVFAKYAGRRWVRIDPYGAASAGTDIVWFDIQNGVVGTQQANATGRIESRGNGWYRLIWTSTTTAGTLTWSIRGASADNNSSNYAGLNGDAFYLWGAQLEAGTFPSSYIPTTGSTAARNAETCYLTLTSAQAAILSVGGTMVVEWTPLHASTSDTATYPIAALFTTSASDCIRALLYQTGINLLVNATGPGKTVDIFMSSVVTAHTKNKFAVTWASNSVNLAVGGSSGTRDVSATIPSVATLLVGATSALGNIQGAIIHRITIYANSTASDTALAALST